MCKFSFSRRRDIMTKKQHIKDPGSAITHFIGMLMAIFAAIPLLIKAAHEPRSVYVVSLAIYAASLILLYAASTTYHTFDLSEKVNTILKKIDHMMIFILIAGSYTPICLLAGGIIYTIGGIIYALKVPIFDNKHKNFGSHEIFHLFVMGGSACHFVLMYVFLLP